LGAKISQVYVGDSASLSFLQNIRRIVAAAIGPCSFTTDHHRHRIIEAGPVLLYADIDCSEPSVNLEEALELTTQFTFAVSGALDLFDSQELLEQIGQWTQDPLRSQWSNSSTLFLVLAIGAQARAQRPSDDYTAESYFSFGRHQATMHLMDDQSIFTVQSFSLITWYMVANCRRSAAVMNLGIAIQAAFTLGIHQHEANVTFEKEARLCRERAWKTLRFCDIFLSSSMGRPLTTSNLDCNGTWSPPMHADDQARSDMFARGSSAPMQQLCLIFERILSEVYSKRTVSLELATSISKQHRNWTTELPQMLMVDDLPGSVPYHGLELTRFLGSANLIMAYYWSIILLTRPFLTFRVSSCINNKGHWQDQGKHSPDITTYSDACITSAIKSISMAHEVVVYNGTPKRLPLVINSVFMSALSLGLAYFGDYDCQGWPLDRALTQATTVLRYFASRNPQAARYLQIIEMLWDAASKYKRYRNDDMLQSQSQRVSNLFGDVGAQPKSDTTFHSLPNDHSRSNVMLGFPIPGACQVEGQDSALQSSVATLEEWETILEDSMITTSGKLASRMNSGKGYQYPPLFGVNNIQNASFSTMSPLGSSNFSHEDEVALFAFMDDYQAPDRTL